MSAIKLNSSGGGSITISPASTASTLTLTAPAQTGTIGLDGPAFSVYNSVGQTISNNTVTKVIFNIENFDTANCFDSTTNYRFTPNVAGYYQISLSIALDLAGTSVSTLIGYLSKNGTYEATNYSTYISVGNTYFVTASKLLYMNGSTDYIEAYCYQNQGVSRGVTAGASFTYMTGAMVRAA